MSARVERAGLRYERLTVVKYAGIKSGIAHWQCRCDCGATTIVSGRDLAIGHSKSCGCLSREKSAARTLRHGKCRTPEYRSWKGMKERCLNPNERNYDRWGGRGIRICDEWRDSFEAFFAHVGPRPSPGHSIDRINNDGHYEPGNVRWATRKEQANNRRKPIARAITKHEEE